jgi:hypothetical protein
MLAGVHRRPPPSANCPNTIWVTTGERRRTGMNETETETEAQAPHHRPARPHPAGVLTRIAQRLLAMAACIWHNWQTGANNLRSLIAYDH